MTHPHSEAAHLLADLDEAQRQAVTSPASPLAILAPAGSGKTRVLTRRIAWRVATGDADSPHVLALTFTRKAAGELFDRLGSLGLDDGVAAGTFHGIAYAQLRQLWSDGHRTPPGLLTQKASLLGEAASTTGSKVPLRTLGTEIEWAKARLHGPDGYAEAAAAAKRRPIGGTEAVAAAYHQYEQAKQRAKLVDFDDLLKLCSDALLNDNRFAAAQRWRFRHIFVDEFQDVNPLQLRLLDAWRGERQDLCVVGDAQQAIYAWNGADASFLRDFQKLYPAAEVISLELNYRSSPQVLNAANQVLENAKVAVTPTRATRPDDTPPQVRGYATERAEAQAIARAVRDHHGPRTPWAAQAVLVRTHAQVEPLTDALQAVRIPFRVRGAANSLDDPDLREALRLLRSSRGALANALPDLHTHAEEVQQRREEQGLEGLGALGTLLELADEHQALDSRASAAGFIAWAVATLQAEGPDGDRDAVTVATFHAAKGLEWPVVHLAGLEDGFVPITHARTTAARAEEARLLYVAMTRALRTLSCTWSSQRTFNGRIVERRLSPWLRDLAEQSEAQTTPKLPLAPDWHHRLAEQRQRLVSARPEPSPALVVARAWRAEVAHSARVEPATVMTDEMLEAVAAAAPTDTEELAAVPGINRMLVARLGDGLLRAFADLPRTS